MVFTQRPVAPYITIMSKRTGRWPSLTPLPLMMFRMPVLYYGIPILCVFILVCWPHRPVALLDAVAAHDVQDPVADRVAVAPAARQAREAHAREQAAQRVLGRGGLGQRRERLVC